MAASSCPNLVAREAEQAARRLVVAAVEQRTNFHIVAVHSIVVANSFQVVAVERPKVLLLKEVASVHMIVMKAVTLLVVVEP